jgi:ethanolamine ammonia-lyase small subunit
MKELRRFTIARVGLGRAGNSLPTRELLDFQWAHARARDAVLYPFDAASLQLTMATRGWNPVLVKSGAKDRPTYLRRPDLGRRLSLDSRASVAALGGSCDTVFVIADGLSPLAVHRHAVNLLDHAGCNGPVVLVEQGRVAIGDEIGELCGASLAVVLIGERPGLSSPDSLGVYLTWSPRIGRTDAERNCISNIHAEGFPVEVAAKALLTLITGIRQRKLSGVAAQSLRQLSR